MSTLTIPKVQSVTFERPNVFFTVHANGNGSGIQNPVSARVIHEISKLRGYKNAAIVCPSENEARRIAGPRAVALFDGNVGNGEFRPTRISEAAPHWASTTGTLWGVMVGSRCGANEVRVKRCAHQTRGMYVKRFKREISRERYPWGQPKKGSTGPKEAVLIDPNEIATTLNALNSGPNLAEAIADRSFAAELPPDSKISWIRVLPEPIGYSRSTMSSVVNAMRQFEIASHELLENNAEVRRVILSGVTLKDPRLTDLYINPGVSCFSIARPDLHWTENGLSASENDEMPGGMPELVLLDKAYGVNQDKWRTFFDWLTSTGPLLFIVSHEWSKCYVPEMTWLVDYLRSIGYDARILTTDRLGELSVSKQGVIHNGDRIGTIWRQFPVFETVGVLADIVELARAGSVRLYPEWGHFGNKAWFYLFWKYINWFKLHMSAADIALLRQVLPESHLIEGERSFPFQIGSTEIRNLGDLKTVPESCRDELVMKICGANSLAARSYGVLMGQGIKTAAWSEWIETRLAAHEPFIVQARFQTGVASIPVWNTGKKRGEMFQCRLLMRPWVLNGVVVSVSGTAVPRKYHKVHGMVDMAVTPVLQVD